MTTKLLLCTSAVLLTGLVPALVGCKSSAGAQMAPIVDGNAAATDPTAANLATPYRAAPASAPVRYASTSKPVPYELAQGDYPPQQQGSYPTQGNSGQNEAYRYNTQPPANGQYNGNYGDPQYGQQGNDPNAQISDDEYSQYQDLLDPNVPQTQQPPPPLPGDYEQPEAPGDGYLWTPGYWDYASAGYFYVPGVWVAAPYTGALWTPGWWGYAGSGYRWHHGYWGPHVGFYGGVNYGFGYIGFGYQGGYWNNNHFFYNTAVNRVGRTVVNDYTYNRRVTVINNTYINNTRTSYYGGPGGLRRGPAPQEFAARREQRIPPMQAQVANRVAAQNDRQQFFNANRGRPQMLTVARPLPADRGIQAPARVNGGQPGSREGFANGNPGNRPGFVNGNPANVQARPGFDQQRQQQEVQRGQDRDQLLQQRDQNLQQRDANLQQRGQDLQQRQQVEQQRQQQTQQRQQADVQRQQQVQQQQRPQFDQQRQQQDAQRQQQDLQRQQQAQQQRQQVDVQRQAQQQSNQQRQVQQQQFNQQRQVQQQPQHIEAPRPAPSAPRMEAPHAAPAPHVEAPHGGGGEHR